MPNTPMITAIDLIRTNVSAMPLADLELHVLQVLDTLAELNDYINTLSVPSRSELNTALKRSEKLRLHLLHVRSLIDAQKAAAAWIATAQQSAGNATQDHAMPNAGP
jgi:hypothetical protein